ncbi:hypothetical protein DPMN_106666 [Dreissena polymorpha]|uniref:Uncharacterized protein n=1 Tax=Dreissena polymorpha TaxID=45954 RepID=A0A9D4K5M7_DREPO|nr:hypothetical protein DPMN_106666 [Dreissena polymorpha]
MPPDALSRIAISDSLSRLTTSSQYHLTLLRLAMYAQCHLTHYQGWPRLHNAT